MKLKELSRKLVTPLFFGYQVEKLFPTEPKHQINTQLSRMVRRGDLIRLKRGVFTLAGVEIDEFVLANILYRPSYVSLESALNSQGIIPDVAAKVTSVSPITSKRISTSQGTFWYSKISRERYFGFVKVQDAHNQLYYDIAEAEKALLDWIYIRKIRRLQDMRVDLDKLDPVRLAEYGQYFPRWVRKCFDE